MPQKADTRQKNKRCATYTQQTIQRNTQAKLHRIILTECNTPFPFLQKQMLRTRPHQLKGSTNNAIECSSKFQMSKDISGEDDGDKGFFNLVF